MAKIKILPDNLSNKIAAGEVVQRPESVVKELIENSIDAGADTIEVLIKKAGKALIQVVDNGEGMNEEDAEICIRKHATSKISGYDDLEAVKTLGFRGEALSSVAAVSQLEIKTETMNDELGTLIRLDDDETIYKEKGSFPKGTSVSVKNLFYNTPGRRNFLKTDATELKHVVDTFNKLALSYPDKHFKLYVNDGLASDYTPGKMHDRIEQVFGAETVNSLIEIEERTDYYSLTGFIGKPVLVKKSRGDQYLFLNNRSISSKQINHAVFSAYENVLEKGDYPFFILFLEIDPVKVDVNVHPSKLEVRFDDEQNLYRFVRAVIRKGLASYDLVPAMAFTENPAGERLKFESHRRAEKNDFSDRPAPRPERQKKFGYSDDDIDKLFSSISGAVERDTGSAMPEPFDETEEPKAENQKVQIKRANTEEDAGSGFLIQLHNKYILSQIKSGLMIIDQHVAHERILYEKALHTMNEGISMSQPLLFPKEIKVDPGIYELLKELSAYLGNLGFDLKFKKGSIIGIEAVPDDVKQGNEENILLDIAAEYAENMQEKKLEETDNVAKSYSCKTAIKAGDKLSDNEMRVLIDELFATSMPYVCPHGRPVVVKIPLEEFDRRFGRT